MNRGFTALFNSTYQRIVTSWVSVAGVIFVVFAISILLIDDFPINADDHLSMGNAGRFSSDFNLISVVESVATFSEQHVPGYFVMLSIWGNSIDWSPTVLRILSVYFGVLSLALMYRLGRDYISIEAGLLATILLASLTFYNIWYLMIRMYIFYVFAELLLLWIYFRIILRPRNAPLRDYVWVALASFLFINSHIFSITVFLALSMYHLIFVPKTRNWYAIAGAVIVAAVIFLPWGIVLIEGIQDAMGPRRIKETSIALHATELLSTILHLGVNGSVLFLGVILLSLKDVIERNRFTIALWSLTICTIAFLLGINEATNTINLGRSRYLLIVFPFMILLTVQGMMVFQRCKIIVTTLLVFWIASGLLFHRRIGYSQYTRTFSSFPIHLIERHLRQEFFDNDLLIGLTGGSNLNFEGPFGKITDLYFKDDNIHLDFQHTEVLRYMNDGELLAHVSELADNNPTIWFVYETDQSQRFIDLYHQALRSHTRLCYEDESLSGIVIERYDASNCE